MQLQVRNKCTHCENGHIYNADWRDYNSRWMIALKEHPEEFKKAYPNAWEKANPTPQESEELLCPECDGTLWVYKWMELEEIIELFRMGGNKE